MLDEYEAEISRSFGGEPKSFIWETHAVQGQRVSSGHYEATCPYKKFIYGNDTFCIRFAYVFTDSVSQFRIIYNE